MVITVVLALQLAAMTFTIDFLMKNKLDVITYLYIGLGMGSSLLCALALFMGARDPRQSRFQVRTLINSGAVAVGIGAIFGAGLISFGLWMIVKRLDLVTANFFVMVSIIGVFISFYAKFVWKNSSEQKIMNDALTILKKRLVQSEITIEEFEKLKKAIE